MKRIIPSWDEYFMLEAIQACTRSKDPSTQVGCVIVNEDNHQMAKGYNGFIAGIKEDHFTWDKGADLPFSETKYAYVNHAEANALIHSESKLKNCTVYVTLFPCNECAKLLAGSQIKRVVYLEDKYKDSQSCIASRKILDAAGIKYESITIRPEVIQETIKKFSKLLNK